MKTQVALRVHEDVVVRHERLRLHADAAACSRIIALAPAHREVTALDNVLVKMPESAEGIG